MYIAIGVLVLCLIGGFTWMFTIHKNVRELRRDIFRYQKYTNRELSKNISEMKPLIDKYKKELKKKNWKSYNEWYNKNDFKTCYYCRNNNFTIDTDYDIKIEKVNEFRVKEVKDCPTESIKRCEVCGTVVDEWKAEE